MRALVQFAGLHPSRHPPFRDSDVQAAPGPGPQHLDALGRPSVPGGQEYCVGYQEFPGTDDVGVMWRMVDGVPTIAWTGFGNFTPIAPLAKIR